MFWPQVRGRLVQQVDNGEGLENAATGSVRLVGVLGLLRGTVAEGHHVDPVGVCHVRGLSLDAVDLDECVECHNDVYMMEVNLLSGEVPYLFGVTRF